MYLIWPLCLVSLVAWSSQHELSPKGLVRFSVVKVELSLLTYINKYTLKQLALCLARANVHTQQKEPIIYYNSPQKLTSVLLGTSFFGNSCDDKSGVREKQTTC